MEAVNAAETPPAKRARTHRRRRNWMMLDRVLARLEDDDFARYASFTDLTEGITSAGEKIVVAFRAVKPPKTSRIFFKLHLNDPKCIWLDQARAVAADGDCILLWFFIIDDSYNIRRRRVTREEFFIYRASPLALTNLPWCGHELINFDEKSKIGILCYNDGEFAVAHITRNCCSGQRATADLCCLSSKDLKWRTTKSVPILNAEGQDPLIWWGTDTVLAIDQHLCFVDYLRGVLFYDVSSPIPQLYYAPLPVDPYLDDINRETGSRGPLSAYRSVCVTKDGLKFVDVEYNGCWFYPAHWHVPYAVSTWTMSMTKPNYEWVKDSCMEVGELDAIINQHKLPSSQLRFPLVDREKPELIYFALEEVDKRIYGETYLVIVDMRKKVLANVIHYTFGGFKSLKDNVCNDTFSLNLTRSIEFLPCEFSEHLDQDEPHGRDKDVGGSIEVPESSTLRPQKHGSPTTP